MRETFGKHTHTLDEQMERGGKGLMARREQAGKKIRRSEEKKGGIKTERKKTEA